MSWMGKSVRRVEDDPLLKGRGKFVADVRLPGTLEAVFLRSPHAHAVVRAINATAARAAPGVTAVITAADIVGRTAPICVAGEVHTPERLLKALKPLDKVHPTPLLPEQRVTYVGQPVAMVVAETLDQAKDAAELLAVDYETITQLAREGMSLVLVEQNVAESLAICKRAYVLENGKVVLSGRCDALLADDRVRQAYDLPRDFRTT